MKFLHTADIHVGSLRDYPDYLVRQGLILDAIDQIAEDYKCDFIVVSGDVFDVKNLQLRESERMLVKNMWLHKHYNAQRPRFVISGNHDIYAHGLTWLDDVELCNDHMPGLQVVTKEPVLRTLPALDVQVLMIPNAGYSLSELKDIAKQFQKYRKGFFLIMAHEPIAGVTLDNGFVLPGENIWQKELCSLADYWAFGDIHGCQQVGTNAFFSGGPAQKTFGEKPGKGVLIVDSTNPTQPEFVLVKGVPELVTVTKSSELAAAQGNIVRINAETDEDFQAALEQASGASNILQVNVNFEVKEVSDIKTDDLTDHLPEWLAEDGYSKDDQNLAVKLIGKVINEYVHGVAE